MRRMLISLAMVLLAGGPKSAMAQQDKCYEWTEAAPIVRREQLAPAREVQEQARKHLDGELIRMTLCEESGQFVYRLVIRVGGGRVRYLTVNARTPFSG